MSKWEPYLFIDNDAYLFHCSEELIKCDLALVVDIEELERLGHKAVLSLVGRALLGDLCPQISLKSMQIKDLWFPSYLLISLFIFILAIY
jgi:hypothetical protein